MPNIIVNRRVVLSGSAGYVFTPEAEEFFSYLVVQPSPEQKIRYDQYLFRPLLDAGIFTELDRIWVPAAELEQHGTISLVNPSSTALTLVNAPTWTQLEGWNGNGTTQYININLTLSAATKFTQNSGCMFAYCRDNKNTDDVIIGANTATIFSYLLPRTIGGNFVFRLNSSSVSTTVAVADSFGLTSIARLASNSVKGYKRGIEVSSNTTASNGRPNINTYVLANNTNGVASNFSTRQASFWGLGSGGINQGTLETIMTGYMTAIGKNV